MSLITCPECKKQISEHALSCPNCGFQLTPEKVAVLKREQIERLKKEQEERDFFDSLGGENPRGDINIPRRISETVTKLKKEQEERDFFDSLGGENSRGDINISRRTSETVTKLKTDQKNTKMGWLVFVILVILVIILIAIKKSNDYSTKVNTVDSSNIQQTTSISEKKSNILKFEITEKKDISFSGIPRMVNRIILDVDSLPIEQEMKNVATYIWENGNKNWEEFTVFIYLPMMNTQMPAYGVGIFGKNGLVKFVKQEFALEGTKWEIKKTNESLKPIPNAKLKEYKIEFSEINQVDKKIKLKLKTNFPDGTVLHLWIYRTHYCEGKSEVYSGDLFSNDFIVKNGEIGPIENIIDDTKWYTEYTDLVKKLPNDMPPISKISDNITIDVMYSPLRSQPANVTVILGSHGEFVTGKGLEYFGTGSAGRFTKLSVSKELFSPMEGRVEIKSKFVSYLSLKENETYAISKETPLAPEFQPSDPLTALSRIKYLPTGSRIRILSIKDKDDFPWYEVQVMNKNGTSIGEGWINSIALNGQEIVIIK